MGCNVKIIDSVAELRDRVADWGDLWQRSSVENPLVLAEPIVLWIPAFILANLIDPENLLAPTTVYFGLRRLLFRLVFVQYKNRVILVCFS